MAKIIAVANQKGGVAKTTTTYNLGVGLARAGKRVLLLDIDPQGNLTYCMGYRDADSMGCTLATVMDQVAQGKDVHPGKEICPYEESGAKLDLIPGNIELAGLEVFLVNVMSRELVLRQYLDEIRDGYDYILIDCPPSLGMLTLNAFAASDSVLVPVHAAYLSLKGMEQLIANIGMAKKRLNPRLEIEGILFTMVNNRTNCSRELIALLREEYGDEVCVFSHTIPQSVKAVEISQKGVSIFVHDPKGKVAAAYQGLTEEVLAHE